MVDATAAAIDLPFSEAVEFFRAKARVPSNHWTDVWRTAHSHSFMVAGATSDALLSDFQASIQKALSSGTTLAEFRRDFDTIVQKHGWDYNGTPGWRSRIIYETNLSTAYSAGRYAQLTEPDTLAMFPYWQYIHSGSSHPRLQHLAWNGLVLRADDPFWESHFPPNGWRCGCRVRPVSHAGLGRMGKSGPDSAPPKQTRPWRNPHTGAVHDVPVGIDPGFDYNPGMAWKQGGRAIPVKAPDLVEQRPPGSQNPATPDQIRQFIRKPEGELPVGRLASETQDLLGAETDTVTLSEESMAKQFRNHPDLTEDDYAMIPIVLSQPQAILDDKALHLLLLRLEEIVYSAVVKRNKAGDKIFLQSFHKMSQVNTKRRVAKRKLLLGSLDAILNE